MATSVMADYKPHAGIAACRRGFGRDSIHRSEPMAGIGGHIHSIGSSALYIS